MVAHQLSLIPFLNTEEESQYKKKRKKKLWACNGLLLSRLDLRLMYGLPPFPFLDHSVNPRRVRRNIAFAEYRQTERFS